MSKNYREILDNLIPSSLTSSSSNQVIINETYKNNLGNKMLHFIYQLQNNIRRRNNGGQMCVPIVNWTPTTSVILNCIDNLYLFGALSKSEFYRIANVYAKNIQTHKMYLHMKSQGKSYTKPRVPA
jgi:hypothetical protein